MKRSMTSRMLLGAALLIAGVSVAAAQSVQAGGQQRSETKAQAGAHKSGGQAQVQHKQSAGGAMSANHGAAHASGQAATNAATHHAKNAKSERAKVAQTKASTKASNKTAAKSSTKSSNKTAMHAQANKAKAQRTAQKAKPAADMKSRTAAQTNTRARSTTGQGSSETKVQNETRAGRAQITAEQQTKLRTAMNARNVPRVRRVNFALRTGIVVPRTVRFARVTAFPVLIDLYPDYRAYSFFVANDEVVFVDSGRRIVDVVPFEGGAVASSGGGGGGAMAMETDLSQDEIRAVQTVLVEEGFPVEVTGVWDPRTRDALILFQRRHGFAATGFIDTRTVAALRLNGKISENHIRGANRATTGRGNARESIGAKAGTKSGDKAGMESKTNMQPRQERSTSGQGRNEQRSAAQGRNAPKAQQGANEQKATPKTASQPKSGQELQPRAEQKGAQRSTTGQGSPESKINRSEPKAGNQPMQKQ